MHYTIELSQELINQELIKEIAENSYIGMHFIKKGDKVYATTDMDMVRDAQMLYYLYPQSYADEIVGCHDCERFKDNAYFDDCDNHQNCWNYHIECIIECIGDEIE